MGYFVDTLQPTLDELGQVDYAFIDGHHNPGMDEAWDIISADERVSFACDFRRIGVCLIEH